MYTETGQLLTANWTSLKVSNKVVQPAQCSPKLFFILLHSDTQWNFLYLPNYVGRYFILIKCTRAKLPGLSKESEKVCRSKVNWSLFLFLVSKDFKGIFISLSVVWIYRSFLINFGFILHLFSAFLFSQISVKIHTKCSQNAAKILLKFSQSSVTSWSAYKLKNFQSCFRFFTHFDSDAASILFHFQFFLSLQGTFCQV